MPKGKDTRKGDFRGLTGFFGRLFQWSSVSVLQQSYTASWKSLHAGAGTQWFRSALPIDFGTALPAGRLPPCVHGIFKGVRSDWRRAPRQRMLPVPVFKP